MNSHEIDYEIFGDDMQIVEIELDPGDQLLRVLLQTPDELEWFAQADGFPNWEEFRGFFEGSDRRGLPWFGFVIYWRDLKLTTTG